MANCTGTIFFVITFKGSLTPCIARHCQAAQASSRAQEVSHLIFEPLSIQHCYTSQCDVRGAQIIQLAIAVVNIRLNHHFVKET